jgi:hypothetical protein
MNGPPFWLSESSCRIKTLKKQYSIMIDLLKVGLNGMMTLKCIIIELVVWDKYLEVGYTKLFLHNTISILACKYFEHAIF